MPCPTLTRHPFELITLNLITSKILILRNFEAERVLMNLVNFHENDVFLKREVSGSVALSNPKYDLYHKLPNPTIDNNFEKTTSDGPLQRCSVSTFGWWKYYI